MTDQPRLLDAHRRASEAARGTARPEPSQPARELREASEPPPGWTEEAEVLAHAGWTPKVRCGVRIWCKSRDDPWCGWYSEEMAYLLVEREEG